MESQIAVSVNRQFTGKLAPDADWKKFNDSFEAVNVTQREFAIEIWRGHAYTSPHSQKRWWIEDARGGYWSAYRYSENWQCSYHLAVDFDTKDERSTFDYLLADPFIAEHAAFLHTTASHTPDQPKARAVFTLAEPMVDYLDYRDAAAAITRKYKGHADRACKDPMRLFFGAPRCDVKMLGNWLPMDVVDEMLTEFWRAMLAEEKQQRERRQHLGPLSEDMDKARDALARIPQQMEYEDWLKVLMAIHSKWSSMDGVALAEGWSPGYPNEIEQKFKSFGSKTNISISTLFWYARQHGWVDTELAEAKVNQVAILSTVR